MESAVNSIAGEFRRYKAIAEAAMAQVPEAELHNRESGGGNSVTVVAWHIAGNLLSRFTDFLDTDGEKPWRNRDEEFADREPSRQELLARWELGWSALFGALELLGAGDLDRTVTIRGHALTVTEALHRSLAHTAYHVGQIVCLAKSIVGAEWRYLSIPPGGSAAYNQNPTRERPA